MARLKNANKALKYDKRLAKYNLSNGIISHEEHQSIIDNLEDLQSRCEPLTLENEVASSTPTNDFQPQQPVAPSHQYGTQQPQQPTYGTQETSPNYGGVDHNQSSDGGYGSSSSSDSDPSGYGGSGHGSGQY